MLFFLLHCRGAINSQPRESTDKGLKQEAGSCGSRTRIRLFLVIYRNKEGRKDSQTSMPSRDHRFQGKD